MIPALATIVWAYVTARLLQIPAENWGASQNVRAWLMITSAIGLVIAIVCIAGIWASQPVSTTPHP